MPPSQQPTPPPALPPRSQSVTRAPEEPTPGDDRSRWRWLSRIGSGAAAAAAKIEQVPLKTVSAVLLVIVLASYAIDGAGRTVISAFRVPGSADLAGADAESLTTDLIAEMARIRAVQETARQLRFQLVKGLESQEAGLGGLDVDLSVRINADYKSLIDNLGSVKLEWGAIQLPMEMVLRPLQRLLRQRVLEVALARDGDRWRALTAADDGRMWEASTADSSAIAGTSSCSLRCLLRALALKMAFLNGSRYEPEQSWIGYYHFHEGVRRLLDYDLLRDSDPASAAAILGEAREHFERAVALNPAHRESRYNLLLTAVEQASYVPLAQRSDAYRDLIGRIKASPVTAEGRDGSWMRLLIAAYVLLAESARQADDPHSAIAAYEAALILVPPQSDLRTYLLNNLGLTYRNNNDPEHARQWFAAAIEQNPTYLPARVNLANAALQSGDYVAAESAYIAVLQRQPAYPGALYNLAVLLQALYADPVWDQLDAGTRECLQREARAAIATFVAQLERDGVTRNLSADEQRDLKNGRVIIEWIASIAPTDRPGDGVIAYRACLTALPTSAPAS